MKIICFCLFWQTKSICKGKDHPATGRGGPRGSGQVKAANFLDVRHYEGGRSSALRTGRLYPRSTPGTHFQRPSQPQGIWFRREPRKKSPVTPPGIDPGTVRLVAQCLNHYATPGPYSFPSDNYNRNFHNKSIKKHKIVFLRIRCSIQILLIKLFVVAFVRCRNVRCSVSDCITWRIYIAAIDWGNGTTSWKWELHEMETMIVWVDC